MVVDRAQLWIFFLVTTIGTIGILMDAPHIFEFVDQDKIIDIYRGKWKPQRDVKMFQTELTNTATRTLRYILWWNNNRLLEQIFLKGHYSVQ